MPTKFLLQPHKDSTPTEDCQKVLDYLNSYLQQWEETIGSGGLPGHAGHYYANVLKLHTITPTQWLLEYANAAEAILADIRFLEAKAADKAKLETVVSGTAAELAKFKEEVAKQVEALAAENARLAGLVEAAGKNVSSADKPAELPAKKNAKSDQTGV